MRRSFSSGVSLVELLVVLGVLLLLTTLTVYAYNRTNAGEALDTDALRILSELSEARSLTIASKNADTWGVHIGATSITLFEGGSYSVGAAGNITTTLNAWDSISSTSISGGGSDIVFQRLTGETTNSGTIQVSASTTPVKSRTITIYQTGIAEIQ